MVVGRHIDFGDGTRLQIFRHGNGEVRAVKDEPGFRLDVNSPLPAHQLYQRHRVEHDPPVASGIFYHMGINQWVSGGFLYEYASWSSFAKKMVLRHFYGTHQTNSTSIRLNRYHTNGTSGKRGASLIVCVVGSGVLVAAVWMASSPSRPTHRWPGAPPHSLEW